MLNLWEEAFCSLDYLLDAFVITCCASAPTCSLGGRQEDCLTSHILPHSNQAGRPAPLITSTCLSPTPSPGGLARGVGGTLPPAIFSLISWECKSKMAAGVCGAVRLSLCSHGSHRQLTPSCKGRLLVHSALLCPLTYDNFVASLFISLVFTMSSWASLPEVLPSLLYHVIANYWS